MELEIIVSVTLDAMKEGDMIRMRNDEFSSRFMFSLQDCEVMAHLIRTGFSDSAVIVASHGHYIIAKDGALVAMDPLLIGDETMGVSQVFSINDVIKQGLYNSHTLTVDVAVHSILASSYTHAIEPFTTSALLVPLRIPAKVPWEKSADTVIQLFTEESE